jgi:hypothetical protein
MKRHRVSRWRARLAALPAIALLAAASAYALREGRAERYAIEANERVVRADAGPGDRSLAA